MASYGKSPSTMADFLEVDDERDKPDVPNRRGRRDKPRRRAANRKSTDKNASQWQRGATPRGKPEKGGRRSCGG